MEHLHRSGTFSRSGARSHRPCGNVWPTRQWSSKLGHNSRFTFPLFLERKKNNTLWVIYTHTHTFTPTHWRPSHKHTVRTSIDQGQFMSLWRSSNHNSHTGHTRHSHTLSVKTYRTVQTLQTHMRKFHLMVSKAPFSHSHHWFPIWSLMVKYSRQEKQRGPPKK